MYRSHNRKYDTDPDPINRSRWEKDDTSKSAGHDAGVAKMKSDFDAGIKKLEQLMLADQVIQCQEQLDSAERDDEKEILQNLIKDAKRKLSSEGRGFITEGQNSLQKRVAALREDLGSKAWSLRFYDEPVSEKILEKFGIVPEMGRVIDRGETGKDRTR